MVQIGLPSCPVQRGAPPSPQPLSLLLCVTVTVLAVPILAWSGSSDDQEPASIEVVAESPSTESEATGLLAEADPDELFRAGADDEQMPDNLAVMAPATPDWPIVEEMTGRVVGKAPFGSEMSLSLDESPAASATADSAATTVAPTTTTRPTATTQAPTTAAPATEPPTTQAPTTAAPATTQAPTTAAPAAPSSGEPTAAQWEALRQCESWGDYTVRSSNGLYHGAYQFGIGTWDNLASALGRNDLVGVLPNVASPADQDMMALELWRRSGWAPWPSCGRKAAAVS